MGERRIEYSLTELLAEQHEAGRAIGYDEGYGHGHEDAREELIGRVENMIRERSGSEHDVGLLVLRDLKRRLQATVADVTPAGVRSHG